MKIKVVFDSTCGYSKAALEKKGAFLAPLTISVNGVDYLDGVNMDAKWMEENMNKDSVIKTASVALGDIEKAYRAALKEADHVIYISMSKKMSSSCSNGALVGRYDEFAGKVTVIDSIITTPHLYLIVDKVIELANKGDVKEVVKFVEDQQTNVIQFSALETLHYLKNSGRISKKEYILGSLLGITPIIAVHKGAITDEEHGIKPSKAKGVMRAEKKMIQLLADFMPKLDEGREYQPYLLYFGKYSKEFEKAATEDLVALGFNREKIVRSYIGGAVTAHVGPEVYAIGLRKVF